MSQNIAVRHVSYFNFNKKLERFEEKKLLCSLFVLWPANVRNTGQGVINSGVTFRDQYLPIVGKCQPFIKHMLICLCLSLQICIITSVISSVLVGSFLWVFYTFLSESVFVKMFSFCSTCIYVSKLCYFVSTYLLLYPAILFPDSIT